MEYSNVDEIFKSIEEYIPDKEHKILMEFHVLIADMLSNKELNPIVTKLIIRCSKLNIPLVFTTQSYFCCAKKC